jgi:hypothetical protein
MKIPKIDKFINDFIKRIRDIFINNIIAGIFALFSSIILISFYYLKDNLSKNLISLSIWPVKMWFIIVLLVIYIFYKIISYIFKRVQKIPSMLIKKSIQYRGFSFIEIIP